MSHPTISRAIPPVPANGEQFKLGHYQMIGQLTGLRFEHTQASVLRDTPLLGNGAALPDDDY
jgi:hypothetical protein